MEHPKPRLTIPWESMGLDRLWQIDGNISRRSCAVIIEAPSGEYLQNVVGPDRHSVMIQGASVASMK